MNKDPIIILDDVFSELDETRKNRVYDILKEYEQVFISGCVKENLKMDVYKIKDEKIVKEELV
jgi:recombinational DNA repair ATPase RecF